MAKKRGYGLVLSRKAGESVIIDLGDRLIEIRVQEVDRGKTRLAVIAPREIPVFRAELLEREADENPRQT